MVEEIIVEMAPEPGPKPFYKTRKGLLILIAALVLLCLGFYSWWLSGGKVESAAAWLDANVYTVGSEFPATLSSISVMPNELVNAGQPLGTAQMTKVEGADTKPEETDGEAKLAAQERETSVKLAQARAEEERAHKTYQDAANEHVSAQLAMRSINPVNQIAYGQAANVEMQARGRMMTALEVFEKISLNRAELERSLNRIRAAIQRVKYKTGKPVRQSAPPPTIVTTELASPVAGKILAVNAAQGQTVQPGQPIFLIMPDGRAGSRWIQAWFPMKDKDKIEPGQKVAIKFEKENLLVSGKVKTIGTEGQTIGSSPLQDGPLPEAQAGRLYLPASISLDNPDEAASVRPGAKATCQIQTRYILGSSLF